MTYLIIFNTILSVIIVGYYLHKQFLSRFSIEIERTTWMKIPYGLIVWYTYKRSPYGTQSKGIFTFRWRDEEYVDILDTKQRDEQIALRRAKEAHEAQLKFEKRKKELDDIKNAYGIASSNNF